MTKPRLPDNNSDIKEREEKKMYAYFVVNKFIIRIFAWKVKAHPGRFVTYHRTNKALFDRAQKYGYTTVTLD